MEKREESVETFRCFDNLTVENKNGKKKVTIDGKEIDLSNAISVKLEIDADGTRLEVKSFKFRSW